MKAVSFWRIAGIVLAVIIVVALVIPLGFRFFSWYWGWAFAPKSAVIADPVSVQAAFAPDSNCYAKAAKLNAPADVIKAICDAKPSGNGVSGRLPVETKVEIGTITFDNEYRVWFLKGFTTPMMASYAFEYKGAEQQLFDAPFVLGSELGYGKDGTRVPFEICWDVTSSGCVPPVDLFPTK